MKFLSDKLLGQNDFVRRVDNPYKEQGWPIGEPVGDIERWETPPETVYHLWKENFSKFTDAKLEILRIDQYWVQERQLIRSGSSPNGHILEHYSKDENGELVLRNTEYVHKGEIHERMTVISLKKRFQIYLWQPSEPEPLEWHKVEK